MIELDVVFHSLKYCGNSCAKSATECVDCWDWYPGVKSLLVITTNFDSSLLI